MNYHITPKQAQEIAEAQFYSLFETIVPREDWYKYHHKKMDIGKMLDIIGVIKLYKSADGLWVVNDTHSDKELTTILWELVKIKVLNKNSEG